VPDLHLRLRYCNMRGHTKCELSEADLHRAFLEVDLPAAEAGFVLVDVWDRHYLRSHLERGAEITRERIVPMLEACRRAGVTIVHAPAPEAAHKYEPWLQYAGDEELFGAERDPQTWPPPDFRSRTGDYAGLAKPQAAPELDRQIQSQLRDRRIIPEAEPQPGDFVMARGSQLQRLCRHRKLLHLFYVGFATNMCVVGRDYGIRAMAALGYNCMLVRDCTTGIESADTLGSMMLTKAAVWEVEMILGFTLTSEELIAACASA